MGNVSHGWFFRFAQARLRRILPSLYRLISYHRNEGRYLRMTRTVLRRTGSRVMAGPFAGMTYVNRAHGSVLAPKLLGCYEEELHPFVSRFVTRSYSRIIDIGAAEGYYAVGLARLLQGVPVFAFDADVEAQKTCRELAALNNVTGQVTVLGFCDLPALREVLADRSLIVCDCEGYEADLLDPLQLCKLKTCDLLVETHDSIRPGTSALLEERFLNTHTIERAISTIRAPSRYPQIAGLTEQIRQLAVNEMRFAGQQWLMLWSHKASCAVGGQ